MRIIKLADIVEETNVYVGTYQTSRAYGGPEEGGWWYTNYKLMESKAFGTKEEAEAYAEEMRGKLNTIGANDDDLSSAKGMDGYADPSNGDPMYDHSDADIPLGFAGDAVNYDVIVEDVSGGHETQGRPHYE